MGNSAYEKLFGAEEVSFDMALYVKHARRLYNSHPPDQLDQSRIEDFRRKSFNLGQERSFHETIAKRITKADKVLRRGRALAEAGYHKYSVIYFRRWFRLMRTNDSLLIRKLPDYNAWAIAWLDNLKV